MRMTAPVRRRQPAPADKDSGPRPPLHWADNDTAVPAQLSRPTLMDLPPEIHVLVSKELIYPDALSLKHTSRYFYNLVDTGVKLKVAWLMERRLLHLECPNDRKCSLRTDLEFCRGSVR